MSNVVRNAFQRPASPAPLHVEHTSREDLLRRTERLFHAHRTRTRTRAATTLFAPLTVEAALARLSPSSLQALLVRRGMPVPRALAERRTALCAAYGTDWQALVGDFRRHQHAELLAGIFSLAGRTWAMPPMSRMKVEQLSLNVCALFEGLRIPPDMVAIPQGGLDDDGEEANDDALLASIGEQWSRPRPMVRLLKLAGMQVPQRLLTAKFQELLHRLKLMGLDIALEGAEACTLKTPSPGLGARLRLRRAAVLPDTLDEEEATSVVVVPSLHVTRGGTAQLSPYESALLRLQFLTCIPCMDRASSPTWPEAFLDAATQGLHITESSRRLLRLSAATFVRGGHDPQAAVKLARMRCTTDEMAALGEAFVRLHPAHPELAAAILKDGGVDVAEANRRSLGALDDLFA